MRRLSDYSTRTRLNPSEMSYSRNTSPSLTGCSSMILPPMKSKKLYPVSMPMAQRYAHLLPENRDVVDKIDGEGTASILLGVTKTTTILRQSEDEKGVASAATP